MKANRSLLGIICITLFCILVVGSWSCRKPDVYPIEPHLEYLGFSWIADSAVLRFSFTDGDGDIGLDDEDTLPPFNKGSFHYNNLRMKYQYLDTVTGTFKDFIIPKTTSTLFYQNSRIKRINKIGTDKSLNGEIQVFLSSLFYYPDPSHKIIRFECQLEDRNLNASNKVITPEIVIPYP